MSNPWILSRLSEIERERVSSAITSERRSTIGKEELSIKLSWIKACRKKVSFSKFGLQSKKWVTYLLPSHHPNLVRYHIWISCWDPRGSHTLLPLL